jgi:hypothetical protein
MVNDTSARSDASPSADFWERQRRLYMADENAVPPPKATTRGAPPVANVAWLSLRTRTEQMDLS